MIKELLHSDGTVTKIAPPGANGNSPGADGAVSDSNVLACKSVEPRHIGDILANGKDGDLLWLDIENPTDDDIALLQQKFGFHLLAIEDIRHSGQRPKVDDYGTFVHIVIYATERDADRRLLLHELDLFYSDHYLVVVHAEPVPALAEAIDRWQRNVDIRHNGVGALLYAILDTIVDGYFPVLDEIGEEIEAIEERIFTDNRNTNFQTTTVQALFTRRRDLLLLRRVVAPARDVMSTISRRVLAHMHEEIAPYVQDVFDHVIRVIDTIDTYRDLLSGAMDASLSVTSNRLNQVMKTMTAGSIILMADALIAGIYGMNFKEIPELSWQFGYPYALLLMVVVSAVIAYLFRRAWWL